MSTKSEVLDRLKELQSRGDKLTKDEFHEAIKSVMEAGILTKEEISSEFKVSLPTVERWMRLSAPVPLARPSVIDRLVEILTSEACE